MHRCTKRELWWTTEFPCGLLAMVPIFTVEMNLSHYGAWPGATGSGQFDPQSYLKLTSTNSSRWNVYKWLRAIDYIIYHGATASQEKDVYGYTGWRGALLHSLHYGPLCVSEAHALAVSVPQTRASSTYWAVLFRCYELCSKQWWQSRKRSCKALCTYRRQASSVFNFGQLKLAHSKLPKVPCAWCPQ